MRIYFENKWKWNNPIEEYIHRVILAPSLPKFLYYDEYYSLPSRISLTKLKREELGEDELKTVQALLDLADLNVMDIIEVSNFEDFKAELEFTETIISNELFKYWSSNSNLSVELAIDKKYLHSNVDSSADERGIGNTDNVEYILYVRIKDNKSKMSLPLKSRSKGFNWFFSFLVWFKKIQEDDNSNYILLLDEPGLNLHASAQHDMLNFIEDLSKDYQVIYTTHSPFAIPSGKLGRVRTVVETDNGAKISNTIQEKDPDTLFPLQAALGYDIAQNLFVSKKNLLIEGVSDLIYLTTMSELLKNENRVGLREDITLVPTGGLEKVATFISLLRGSKLEIACLLDSFTDKRAKAKLEKMIQAKIIANSKVIFFDKFLDTHKQADIEDLFSKKDYVNIFNESFVDIYKVVEVGVLNDRIQRIVIAINKYLEIPRFNHYKPAQLLSSRGVDASFFTNETLNNFEKLFKEVNAKFS